MINENQLLENFQVEELEKRFEMGWIRVSAQGAPTGTNVGGSDTGTIGPMTPSLSLEPPPPPPPPTPPPPPPPPK